MTPIPFRERLAVRLAAGMISVALLSLALTFTLQFIGVALSGIEPPQRSERLQELIAENADDEAFLELVEAPIRIRNIVLRTGFLSVLVSGGLWIFFAIRFARSIARPIEDATLASAQITRGDLATRVQMPMGATGEPARLLEHFNEMATSLETYERERTEMIAAIAHELRTPLAVMRSRMELLEEGVVRLEPKEISQLIRQLDLLTRLVNDLRTLSLADANRLSLELAPVQLDKLVSNVAASLQTAALERGITVRLELAEIQLRADADRLAQVVFNLLDNALKHTPPGGEVSLKLTRSSGFASLGVTDTGVGFEGEPAQLFKRFYTTKNGAGGSGIGLALVKTLVEAHGGTVGARSLEEGAVFEVRLPLERPAISF